MKPQAEAGSLLARLSQLPRDALVLLVRGYRLLLKPWLGNACRFEPTCSAYALQALQQHGAARGVALSGWRLLRCHPWCEGGLDPVPDTFAAAFRRRRGGDAPADDQVPADGPFTRLVRPPEGASGQRPAGDDPIA
jgi:putative membrane protein insertion efficiency factor